MQSSYAATIPGPMSDGSRQFHSIQPQTCYRRVCGEALRLCLVCCLPILAFFLLFGHSAGLLKQDVPLDNFLGFALPLYLLCLLPFGKGLLACLREAKQQSLLITADGVSGRVRAEAFQLSYAEICGVYCRPQDISLRQGKCVAQVLAIRTKDREIVLDCFDNAESLAALLRERCKEK